MSCSLHVYLGLNKVLGGLPALWKGCAPKREPGKGAGELRSLLRARVQGMLARAVREGATANDKNECAELHACMRCTCLRHMLIGLLQTRWMLGVWLESADVLAVAKA